jgi:DNA-binding NarL/FixJ family response regulator
MAVNAETGISTVTSANPSFVIADDHPMVRDALAAALRTVFKAAQIRYAGTFGETQAAISAASETDLLILDLDMPGMQGLAGLAALRASHPTVPVAIVSATTNPAAMRQAIEMGAAGFIPKLAPSAGFLEVIQAILSGVVWLPPEASDDALAIDDREIALQAARLTPQQHRVLWLMAEGKANKVIAYEMQITEPTVKAHVTEILRKLGATSRTQAVIVARRVALEPAQNPVRVSED